MDLTQQMLSAQFHAVAPDDQMVSTDSIDMNLGSTNPLGLSLHQSHLDSGTNPLHPGLNPLHHQMESIIVPEPQESLYGTTEISPSEFLGHTTSYTTLSAFHDAPLFENMPATDVHVLPMVQLPDSKDMSPFLIGDVTPRLESEMITDDDLQELLVQKKLEAMLQDTPRDSEEPIKEQEIVLPVPPSETTVPTKFLTINATKPPVERIVPKAVGTGLIYDEKMLLHRSREPDHPEDPNRLIRTHQYLHECGLMSRLCMVTPWDKGAEDWQLALCHANAHIHDMLQTHIHGDDDQYLDQVELLRDKDVFFNKHSYQCATLSCGHLLNISEMVAKYEIRNGFALIRPPGHHAEYDKAMGFCVFNNVAVAARYLQRYLDVKRIMILDWDIHHGNGIQKEFYYDSDVLYISIHRFENGDFYPRQEDADCSYVGGGYAKGKNLNIPWPCKGMNDADYMHVFQTIIMPIAYEFNPDFVLVAAGFDAADGDPLGECYVTPAGYAHMTHMLSGLANGKLVLALEGGYNCEAIARSIGACVSTLLGDPLPPLDLSRGISEACYKTVEQVAKSHRPYWRCLQKYTFSDEFAQRKNLRDVMDAYHELSLRKHEFKLQRSLYEDPNSLRDNYLNIKVWEYKALGFTGGPMAILAYPAHEYIAMGETDAKGNIHLGSGIFVDAFLEFAQKLVKIYPRVIILECLSECNSNFQHDLPPRTDQWMRVQLNRMQTGVVTMFGVEGPGSCLLSLLYDEADDSDPPSTWSLVHLTRSMDPTDLVYERQLGVWWQKNAMFMVSSKLKPGTKLDLGVQNNVYSTGGHYSSITKMMDTLMDSLLSIMETCMSGKFGKMGSFTKRMPKATPSPPPVTSNSSISPPSMSETSSVLIRRSRHEVSISNGGSMDEASD